MRPRLFTAENVDAEVLELCPALPSMRPRLFTAENAARRERAAIDPRTFNEAAALHRGKQSANDASNDRRTILQ